MFIVLHQLPLIGMFAVVLTVSTCVCWILIGIVRFSVRRSGHPVNEPLPIRDSLINACGGLFALIVAFSAAGIWNDANSARSAVQREADAVETALVLSSGLPDPARADVEASLRAYLKNVVAFDWPAMAAGVSADDPVFQKSEQHLLGALDHVSKKVSATAGSSGNSILLAPLLEIRHARLVRLAASTSGTTWAQWIAMWLISTATLFAITVCNSHSFRMQILATHIYVVVVSAAVFVILAHDRPFIGKISIQPTALQNLMHATGQ